MIDLFLEGKAADKAHSLGLTYGGFGNWYKGGKRVAKTVNDTLMSVSSSTKTKYTAATHNKVLKTKNSPLENDFDFSNIKKSKISKSPIKTILNSLDLSPTLKTGTGDSLSQNLQNILTRTWNLDSQDGDDLEYFNEKLFDIIDTKDSKIPRAKRKLLKAIITYCVKNKIVSNESTLSMYGIELPKVKKGKFVEYNAKEFEKYVEVQEARNHEDMYFYHTVSLTALKTSVKGEKILLTGGGWDTKWTEQPSKAKKKQMSDLNIKESLKQSKWRYSTLSKKVVEKLIDIQNEWQSGSQHSDRKSKKRIRNMFLNQVMKGPPPAVIKVDGFIERGMSLDEKDLGKFLSNFKVGKEVTLPPSGFSAKPNKAREFAGGDVPVLLRLLPKNGKVYGLSLPNADSFKPFSDKIPIKVTVTQTDKAKEKYYNNEIGEKQYQKIINARNKYDDYIDSKKYYGKASDGYFGSEQEIIRPGWAKTKVVAVNKIIDGPDENPKVRFEIILQELGKRGTKPAIVEGIDTDDNSLETAEERVERLKVLVKYTNATLNVDREDEKEELNKDMNTSQHNVDKN